MTCDTENKELEKAYFDFLEEISENVKAADDRLKRRFLASLSRSRASIGSLLHLDSQLSE